MEVRSFRLVLFFSALALAIGVGAGAYLTHLSSEMHTDVGSFYKDLTSARITCEAKPTSDACRMADLHQQGFALAVELRNKYEDQAQTAFALGLVVPGVLLLLFYGVRWSLTGRLRPFWIPIGRNQ